MSKTLHELAKEMLNKANVEVLTETGKLKKEPDKVIKEDEIDESVTRKHFQQVADVIKAHPDAAKRKELAQHHSEIFAKQNPRFDKKKFHAASNAELDEAEINELSKSTLKSYVKKAAADAYQQGNDSEAAYHQGTREQELESHKKGQNRISGIVKAVDKLTKKKSVKEGVNGEHGPDDEDKLKQKEPPFEPDKKPSSNWTSAKNKAKNLARAAMKKQVKKKVNEDKIKPDSKIKVAGKYLFGNTKGNVAHIEGDKTKKITKEGDDWEKLAKKKGLPLNQTPGFKEGPVEKTIRKIGTKLKKLTEADLDELSVEKLHQYRKKSMSTFVPNWNPKNKRVKGVYKAEKQIEKKTGVKQFDVGAS